MILRQVLGRLDCHKSGINPGEIALRKATISTISNHVEIINNYVNTTIILSNGTTLHLEHALSNSRSKRIYLALKCMP